jgi:hypothetical protein
VSISRREGRSTSAGVAGSGDFDRSFTLDP